MHNSMPKLNLSVVGWIVRGAKKKNFKGSCDWRQEGLGTDSSASKVEPGWRAHLILQAKSLFLQYWEIALQRGSTATTEARCFGSKKFKCDEFLGSINKSSGSIFENAFQKKENNTLNLS